MESNIPEAVKRSKAAFRQMAMITAEGHPSRNGVKPPKSVREKVMVSPEGHPLEIDMTIIDGKEPGLAVLYLSTMDTGAIWGKPAALMEPDDGADESISVDAK